jgi:hypothetical protein
MRIFDSSCDSHETALNAWPTSPEHDELAREITPFLSDATAASYDVVG